MFGGSDGKLSENRLSFSVLWIVVECSMNGIFLFRGPELLKSCYVYTTMSLGQCY